MKFFVKAEDAMSEVMDVGRDRLRRHVAEEAMAEAQKSGKIIRVECCQLLIMEISPFDTNVDWVLERANKILSEELDPAYVMRYKPQHELERLHRERVEFERALAQKAMAPARKRLRLQPCAA